MVFLGLLGTDFIFGIRFDRFAKNAGFQRKCEFFYDPDWSAGFDVQMWVFLGTFIFGTALFGLARILLSVLAESE